MSKVDLLIKNFMELIKDKDEVLLQGYDLSPLLKVLKKAEHEA